MQIRRRTETIVTQHHLPMWHSSAASCLRDEEVVTKRTTQREARREAELASLARGESQERGEAASFP